MSRKLRYLSEKKLCIQVTKIRIYDPYSDIVFDLITDHHKPWFLACFERRGEIGILYNYLEDIQIVEDVNHSKAKTLVTLPIFKRNVYIGRLDQPAKSWLWHIRVDALWSASGSAPLKTAAPAHGLLSHSGSNTFDWSAFLLTDIGSSPTGNFASIPRSTPWVIRALGAGNKEVSAGTWWHDVLFTCGESDGSGGLSIDL